MAHIRQPRPWLAGKIPCNVLNGSRFARKRARDQSAVEWGPGLQPLGNESSGAVAVALVMCGRDVAIVHVGDFISHNVQIK